MGEDVYLSELLKMQNEREIDSHLFLTGSKGRQPNSFFLAVVSPVVDVNQNECDTHVCVAGVGV